MRKTLAGLIATAVLAAWEPASAASAAPSDAIPLPRAEAPIAAEKNPPGDIPDNQAFTVYRSPLGFHIKVPEGWARREAPGHVTFSDKYNGLQVTIEAQATEPTLASLRAGPIAALAKSGRAVRITAVKPVDLPAGKAVLVTFGSNSEPNAVTNKAIRLDNARYYVWNRAGKLATITLSSPSGADNADQWHLMSRSFGWLR